MKNNLINKNIILEGVVGSRAYGLATPDSDTDIKGIFVEKTDNILGLGRIKETINKDTCERITTDIEYTEVGKFISLALKCNPTYLELLYLDSYLNKTYEGSLLVKYRDYFLSEQKVKDSYCGYAKQQILKVKAKGPNYYRKEKSIRHTFRLLLQGRQLLTTGTLTLDVSEHREILFDLGKKTIGEVESIFEKTRDEFKGVKSILPKEPDYNKINELLLKIRKANYLP